MSNSYRKTKRGFLSNLYYEMSHRVDPKSTRRVKKGNKKYWSGLPILDREDFIEWGMKNSHFNRLFDAWEATGHIQRFVPTVDRVNPKKGYIIGNMEWVMLSENSHRAAVSRKTKIIDPDKTMNRIVYYSNLASEMMSLAKEEANKLAGVMK